MDVGRAGSDLCDLRPQSCNFRFVREVKQQSTPLLIEAYIRMELRSERRHEYVNGQLMEMPGEKTINNNNNTAGFIYIF
jgi:hypothetical protein